MAALAFNEGDVVVFAGDSITDCGRRMEAAPFGVGYVSLFIEMAATAAPELNVRYINKGIGGNTVLDLAERWEDDVIRERPNWLSVMIGINDLHRKLGGGEDITPERYQETYDSILQRVVEACDARLILIDPFYISIDRGGQTFRSTVLDVIPSYIAAVDALAEKYGALQLKLHDIFQRHLQYRPSEFFCAEPVHPGRSGHVTIAQELLQLVMA